MPKAYKIEEEDVAEIEKCRKRNKNKNVERRLKALLLRAQGKTCAQISTETGFAASYISELVVKYRKKGLAAITGSNYGGNHRNMSFEEEEMMLGPFKKAAEAGQVVEVSEILRAYEKRLGRSLEKDHGQIYRVLSRHGWRKVMPRSKHPNKASDEVIDTSKKLKVNWTP